MKAPQASLVCALLALAAMVPAAHATDIQYTATSLGGTSWRYDYMVTNDDLPALDEFSVYFAAGSFANLVVSASPPGWSSIALQPTASVDGLFDSLALNASLPNGASVDGFSVSFTFLGTGTPGAQPFVVIDPFNGNAILREGITRAIPEPHTLALLLAGLVPMGVWLRRRPGA